MVHRLKWESEAHCYCLPMVVKAAVELVHHFHLDHQPHQQEIWEAVTAMAQVDLRDHRFLCIELAYLFFFGMAESFGRLYQRIIVLRSVLVHLSGGNFVSLTASTLVLKAS